jgi:5-(carboxyamino)imidazole ribonucleotide synthase
MRSLMESIELPNPHWFLANDYQDFALKRVSFSHDTHSNPFLKFPVVIKIPSGGYDGRGVWICMSEKQIEDIFTQINRPLLVEQAVNFDYEASVMVARSPHGQAATWAPTKTIQKDGICTMTITPVPEMSAELSQRVQEAALHIAQEIKLVGVMAVELFVTGDEFLINELALRPHNSGHWSIEGSVTSQFEQHLRAVLDLPLGDTALRAPFTVMGNLLGGENSSVNTDMYRPYLHLMAREPNLKFHQYGKEVRPGRKIGHLTLTGDNWGAMVSEMEHAIAYMQGEIDE